MIDTGETQATLRVNDATETITPSFTEYWDDWQVFTTQVDLTEGQNTIAIELHYDDSGKSFTGDVGGFNLNTVAVTESDAESPIPDSYTGYTPEDENFEAEPEFEFLETVPAGGWDDTIVIDAEIGRYVVTARQKGDEWYVGAMTNGDGRAVDIPLDFLNPGKSGKRARGPKYVAEIYSDGSDTRYDTNPTDVRIDEVLVEPRTTVLTSMAASGGQAIRLRPVTDTDLSELPAYEPPKQEYYSFEAPSVGVAGQPTTVTITGTNAGSIIGGETLGVFIDGEQISTVFVRLAPGESESTVQFTLPSLSAGDHEIRIGWSLDEALPAQTIRVLPTMPLSSSWLFHKGDDMAWTAADYDDNDWDHVELPANWEEHSGYTDDNIFGWYRKTITVPASWEDYEADLLLPVGKIDDVDRTFFNGEAVGQSGSFPADGFSTAWQKPREYTVPAETVNYGGENVIEIRIYDAGGGGGLYAGPLGPIGPAYDSS